MPVLVIAEHDNASIKGATLNTVTAAVQCGGDVHVLVAGADAAAAAQAASKIGGVAKVLHADAECLGHGLAENMAAQVLAIVGKDASAYSHILFPATAAGKNIAPRVAALLDVAQISDATKVLSADTFERPIYAGNAIATVQSLDAIKVITVRTTGFDAAAASGSRILKFSPEPMPRPPETMILAPASSGRSDLATSRPMNAEMPASCVTAMFSTAAEPPVAATPSKPVVRTVMTLMASPDCTVASALPA